MGNQLGKIGPSSGGNDPDLLPICPPVVELPRLPRENSSRAFSHASRAIHPIGFGFGLLGFLSAKLDFLGQVSFILSASFQPGFLSLGITGILGWLILFFMEAVLCGGGCLASG